MSSARKRVLLVLVVLALISANATVPRLLRPVNNLMQGRVGPEPIFPSQVTRAYSAPYRYHLEAFRGEPVTIHYGFRSPGFFQSEFFDPESPYLGAFYGAYAFGPETRVDRSLLEALMLYDLRALVLAPFHPSTTVTIEGPGELVAMTPVHGDLRPRRSYLQYGWPFDRGAGERATYHFEHFTRVTEEGTLVYYALAIDASLAGWTIRALEEAVEYAD